MMKAKYRKTSSRSKKQGREKYDGEGEKPQKSRFSFINQARAKKVQMEDLSPDDFIIAVMGPTGSGKSTFIELATGHDTGIGHNLQSCTSEINIVKLEFPGMSGFDLVFIDTPGFDDTYKSDTEILEMISDWLNKTYEQKVLLSGLLYLHRISDNRMGGAPLKNLRMFEGLCGQSMLQNIVLTTTMWEDVDEETGDTRESELKGRYWKPMIDRGSITRRFEKTTQAGAFKVLEPLLDGAVRQNSLLIQDEMVEMRMKLPETCAGQNLFSELERLLARHQEVLRRMRQEMQNEVEDSRTWAVLKKEYDELKGKLDSVIDQMRELKLPIGKRLLKTLNSAFHFTRRRRS